MSFEELISDRDVLETEFLVRVKLAGQKRETAAQEADAEWEEARAWIRSNDRKAHSFLWYCDVFDLEPSAVRRKVGL
jgi:hypothetical protein